MAKSLGGMGQGLWRVAVEVNGAHFLHGLVVRMVPGPKVRDLGPSEGQAPPSQWADPVTGEEGMCTHLRKRLRPQVCWSLADQ